MRKRGVIVLREKAEASRPIQKPVLISAGIEIIDGKSWVFFECVICGAHHRIPLNSFLNMVDNSGHLKKWMRANDKMPFGVI